MSSRPGCHASYHGTTTSTVASGSLVGRTPMTRTLERPRAFSAMTRKYLGMSDITESESHGERFHFKIDVLPLGKPPTFC